MLSRPNEAPQKVTQPQEAVESTPSTETQYGTQHDQLRILDIPAEILAGITSHLDPPTLQNLSLVNKRFHEHIKDDSIWHRAFVQQFLGISFQGELHDCHKRLLLRREAKTWRQEFITRFNLCRKWAFSRSTTIRHIPVHSAISSMHLMPSQSALLCASTVYGIVSRSLPLTGKILPGYLNPTGPRIGIGIGNPNVEFAPNVSACLLASEGGTAKVLWGIRNGEVAVTVANRAIDPSRRGVNFQLIRCLIDDEHEGPVQDATWEGNELAVTGGADGRLKLWNTHTMRCLWTSEQQTLDLVIDPIIKVASAVTTKGVIAGCMRSGNIVVFGGFEQLINLNPKAGRALDALVKYSAQVLMIPCPVNSPTLRTQTVTSLHIDPSTSSTQPTLLVSYEDDTCFYKVSVDLTTNGGGPGSKIETFGDDVFGAISCVHPYFATADDQCSFVLTGDRTGCISVYDWQGREPPTTTVVPPVRRFEAHIDGSTVTAIHWNGTTLISGSAHGTTHVFDGLTFEELRNFTSPTPRFRGRGHAPPVDPNADARVRQILVNPDRDVLVVSVGNAVLAWKAGPIGKSTSGGVRGRLPLGSDVRPKKRSHGGKWMHTAELKQNIAESRHLLEQEAKKIRHKHGTTRGHQDSLGQLGPSEQEALEYVMMLSREEHARSTGAGGPSTGSSSYDPFNTSGQYGNAQESEEGVFGWSTDEASDQGSRRSESDLVPVSASSSNSSSYENDGARSSASFTSSSVPSINTDDHLHFPPISTSPTPINTPGLGSGSSPRLNVTSSRSSAWGTPLRASGSTTSSPGARGSALVVSSPTAQRRASTASSQPASSGDDMDDDLRFAIELSLAEARSRGENV
ncbi:F-box/WD repeat-containing protein pof10 [Leucoagaricus sp. SymC.cos]|nr:F-box/WD repeat-containing protein pof10 [Leucoagaricus sp. SymC.cos]